MKFASLTLFVFLLFAPCGHCDMDFAEATDNLDSLFTRHQYDSVISSGEMLLELALEEFGPEDTVVARVLLRVVRGYQVSQKGFKKTERYLAQALEITEKQWGHNDKRVASIMNNMAINCWLTGRFERAREIYEESLGILRVTGSEETREMAAVTNNLATLCHTVGDYTRAEELYLLSLPIREQVFGPDHVEVGKCYNNLATLYLNLRLYDKAKKYYDISLEKKINAMGPDDPDVASALLNIATLYIQLDENEEAEGYLTEALRIYEEKYGDAHSHYMTVAISMAHISMDAEDYQTADSVYAELAAGMRASVGDAHPMLGSVLHLWADVKELQGQGDESLSLMTEGLAVLEDTYGQEHYLVADIKKDIAKLQCRNSNWSDAEDNAAEACQIRNRLLNRNVSILNQSDALESSWHAKKALDNYLSCLFHNGRSVPFDTARALDVIANSKGQVADCILRRVDKLDQEQDTTAQRIRAEIGNLKFTLSSLLSRSPDENTSSLMEYVKGLDAQVDAKEKDLAEISSKFRSEREAHECDLEMITAKMPDNSIILDYIRYQQVDFVNNDSIDRYVVTVIDKNEAPGIVELGDASTIDKKIERFRDHMLRIAEVGTVDDVIDMAEYDSISADLRTSIWEPVSDRVSGVENLLISPDGALNLLPFGTLLLDRDSYLVEKHAIHYLPSSRSIIRYGNEKTNNEGLLAVGAPDFEADLMALNQVQAEPGYVLSQSVSVMRGMSEMDCPLLSEEKYRPLPGALREVQAIAGNWDQAGPDSVTVLTGIEATEENFIANSRGKRIIHIATHGFFMDSECYDKTYLVRKSRLENAIIENPLLFSGLLLAGANNRDAVPSSFPARDGVMTANDVTALDLNGVSIVVLSACETGLGKVINSEGVYGLRRAFMEAGAQSVVSTLWPIVDDRAFAVLSNLYSHKEGSVAGKLQEAQVEMIKSNREQDKSNHPFFWGAFFVYGRWIN